MEPLQIVMLEAPFQTYVFALQDGKLRYRALSALAWQDVEPPIEPI